MKSYSLPLIASILLLFYSCKQDKIAPLPNNFTKIVSFQESIEPMVLTSCGTSGCHAVGGVSPVLTNYDEISTNAQNILSRIQLDPTNVQLMPFGGPKLADSIIQNFQFWIDQGLLDN